LYGMRNSLIRFYLFWTFFNVLIYYLPIPDDFAVQFHSLLIIILVGVYLFTASSLAYTIIKAIPSAQRHEVIGSLFLVVVVMSLALIYSRIYGDIGFIGSAMSTANLLIGATAIGSLLSTAIKRIGELVPVCFTAAVADTISVTMGPTKSFAAEITAYYEGGREGAPPLVDFIIIKAGIPGLETPIPLFGVTDWIFLILLSAALIRLGKTDNLLSINGSIGRYVFVPVSGVALYAGFIVAQLSGTFIPAMVFITSFFLVFLILQYKVHRNLKRVDIYYSCFFPCAVAVVLLLYSGSIRWREMFF
jgi:hypothetical protein